MNEYGTYTKYCTHKIKEAVVLGKKIKLTLCTSSKYPKKHTRYDKYVTCKTCLKMLEAKKWITQKNTKN